MALPTKNVKGPQSSAAVKSHSLYRTTRHPVTSELPSRKPPAVDLQAKEEEYKRLNAELEAKTANLVRQVEEVMKEQHQVLSKPLHSHLDGDFENENEDSRSMNLLEPALKHPGAKVVTKRKMGSKTLVQKRNSPRNQRKTQTTKASLADDVAVPEDFVGFSGAKIIQSIEGKLLDGDTQDHDTDDNFMPSVGEEMGSDSQIRFLKAKLRVMQEELNRLSNECNEKDDENISLISKVKQLEEDGLRLQKSRNIQQQQLENHIRLSEEAGRKCEGLKQQLAALHKETESLKRAQTQAASNHSAVEVRLNRALEELERSKTQLNQIRQQSKDNVNQERHKMEVLQAENKKLEKQKAELIVGFKKQLKLIDILKRQKMHFEAAKMLSFTEEEFMKALDWGK